MNRRAQELVLRIEGRPISSNDRGTWRAKAAKIAATRYAARIHAHNQWGTRARIQLPVDITVEHHHRTARLSDVGNCQPAVKAAIDGLCDYGLWPDDGPQHVRALTFLPPRKTGTDELVITIRSTNA